MKKIRLIALILALFSAAPVWAATYQVDAEHSSVTFKIKHMLSKTQGNFRKFSGTIDYEQGKPETWKASGTIDVNSIDTNSDKRDAHLKTADFFEVEKYPSIDFKTTSVKSSTDTTAVVEGVLTMHGIEKP